LASPCRVQRTCHLPKRHHRSRPTSHPIEHLGNSSSPDLIQTSQVVCSSQIPDVL
jgi:hypothetical protein